MAFHSGGGNDLRRHVSPQIHHLEPIIFQQDLYDVFSDIVDISLDCGQDHRAPILPLHSVFCHLFLHDTKGSPGSFSAH